MEELLEILRRAMRGLQTPEVQIDPIQAREPEENPDNFRPTRGRLREVVESPFVQDTIAELFDVPMAYGVGDNAPPMGGAVKYATPHRVTLSEMFETSQQVPKNQVGEVLFHEVIHSADIQNDPALHGVKHDLKDIHRRNFPGNRAQVPIYISSVGPTGEIYGSANNYREHLALTMQSAMGALRRRHTMSDSAFSTLVDDMERKLPGTKRATGFLSDLLTEKVGN